MRKPFIGMEDALLDGRLMPLTLPYRRLAMLFLLALPACQKGESQMASNLVGGDTDETVAVLLDRQVAPVRAGERAERPLDRDGAGRKRSGAAL